MDATSPRRRAAASGSSPPSTAIDTVLLKVASRCNLDCAYCYVYHMGDDGWRTQPARMPDAVQRAAVRQLADVRARQGRPLSVVLHGGEPLLLGAGRLRDLCGRLRSALPPPCGIHVQTNGVLLTDEVVDVCVRFGVGVSISIDGPRRAHDRFRVDHEGRGSFDDVRRGIGRMTARDDARPLFAGVLAVIDPESSPGAVYDHLKATGAPSIDFLVRDGNHARLPFGKARAESTEYGRWLVRLLDVYLGDPDPPRVRVFDDMLRVLLGGAAQKEGVGAADYGILVIDTDGRINKNDTLKAARPGADRFDRSSWSILSDNLLDVVRSPEYAAYYRRQRPTADACRACPERGVCADAAAAIRSALALVGAAPGLRAAVAAYPRSVHVLQPPAAEIDVSYSDPDVPFSVFLSLPRPGRHAALRLAESLVHECMHLQLTLIEAVLPLVEDERASTFSPWRRRPRPLRGVLHGLYVFTVVDAFLGVLERGGSLEPDEARFAAGRRRQIAGEVAQVDQAALAAGLTDDGKVLAGRLLRRVGADLVLQKKVGGHGAEDCLG